MRLQWSQVGSGLILITLVLGSASCRSTDGSSEIVVSAAASLTDAFTEIASAFERNTPDVGVILNFGGSSTLREQILGGAPADVYASANADNMDRVVAAGHVAGTPQIFAYNRLEIAVPAGNPAEVRGLDDFANEALLIGLCAEAVPCGIFGREALERAGVTPAVDTAEPDVRALLTKIEAGELDAGIVYATDVPSASGVEGISIPADFNVDARYVIARLRDAPNPDPASGFVEFVLSPEGRNILSSFGFSVP